MTQKISEIASSEIERLHAAYATTLLNQYVESVEELPTHLSNESIHFNSAKRLTFQYSPSYDIASNVLASTLYHNLDTFTIPENKKWYANHITGTNDSTGNGYFRAYSFDLTSGENTTGDSVRGCIGVVKGKGASVVKAIQGTSQGLTGHTGNCVGVVGETIPSATSGASWAYQATCGNYTEAAMIINGVLNDGTENIGFGIRNYTGGLNFTTAFINYDSKGTADFLRQRSEDGNTVLFKVDSAGNINLSGLQKTITLNNATRAFQLQAVTTGDYLRVISGSVGDVVKFYGDTGVVFGNATGGNKGAGTINAVAVYDDNVLLTCYVIEAATTGKIDLEKWDNYVPDRTDEFGNVIEVTQHAAAREFASIANERFSIDKFSEDWKTKGYLPSLPSPKAWTELGLKMSTGDLIQRLWETVEIQAIHIDNLNQRVKSIEQAS